MSNTPLDKQRKKEAIKNLRAQRKEKIANASVIMKKQKKEMKLIREFLQQGDATLPDIAAGIAMPVNQTVWYLMAMKKYGEVVEAKKEGAYFNYALVIQSSQKGEI